jgi:hypothetical protein
MKKKGHPWWTPALLQRALQSIFDVGFFFSFSKVAKMGEEGCALVFPLRHAPFAHKSAYT